MHNLHGMMDRIRALLTVIEEGSVNRAAVRLRITQPALSRQMQALEAEIGGKLLERETSGVKPTGLGHALVKSMRPLVSACDSERSVLETQVLHHVREQLGLQQLEVLQTVVEKRAAFACTPLLQRPESTVAPHVWACGDYVAGPYPATLEGAVRSGLQVIAQL